MKQGETQLKLEAAKPGYSHLVGEGGAYARVQGSWPFRQWVVVLELNWRTAGRIIN